MTHRRPLGLAVCDRCGLDCRHAELRKEWSGVYVCPKCFEAKHPTLTPRRFPAGEPRPLLHARPPVRLVVDVDAIDILNLFPHTAGGVSGDLTPAPLTTLSAETGTVLEAETGQDLELE
jgi:hypothetical protein